MPENHPEPPPNDGVQEEEPLTPIERRAFGLPYPDADLQAELEAETLINEYLESHHHAGQTRVDLIVADFGNGQTLSYTDWWTPAQIQAYRRELKDQLPARLALLEKFAAYHDGTTPDEPGLNPLPRDPANARWARNYSKELRALLESL